MAVVLVAAFRVTEAVSEAGSVVDSPATGEDLVAAFRVTEAALVASEDLEGSEATVADLEDSTLSRL